MVIERAGPACNMLIAPYNMDVPPFDHTDIDVEEWCHQWCIQGLSAYEYRRSQKYVKLELNLGENISRHYSFMNLWFQNKDTTGSRVGRY